MKRIILTLVAIAAAACSPPVASEGEGEGEGDTPEQLTGTASFTYEDVDGAVCANGTPVGLGVSRDRGSRTLAVFVNGGGACWDAVTCFGLNAASDIQVTYSNDVMQNELAPLAQSGLLERGDDTNPLHDVNLAFIPYCTGDLHDGTSERDYQVDLFGQDIRHVHHAGRTNMAAFAQRLAAEFPDVKQVLLFGASAGGFGAVLNDDLFRAAFHDVAGAGEPPARVDLLADGAPFIPPQNGLYFTWQSQWSMVLPDCADCDTNLESVVEHLRTSQPDRRIALVTTTNDEVIRTFFGFGLNDITGFVNNLVDRQYDVADNAHAFEVTGTQHVLLAGYGSVAAADGTTLKSFFDGWARGDDGFRTVRP